MAEDLGLDQGEGVRDLVLVGTPLGLGEDLVRVEDILGLVPEVEGVRDLGQGDAPGPAQEGGDARGRGGAPSLHKEGARGQGLALGAGTLGRRPRADDQAPVRVEAPAQREAAGLGVGGARDRPAADLDLGAPLKQRPFRSEEETETSTTPGSGQLGKRRSLCTPWCNVCGVVGGCGGLGGQEPRVLGLRVTLAERLMSVRARLTGCEWSYL